MDSKLQSPENVAQRKRQESAWLSGEVCCGRVMGTGNDLRNSSGGGLGSASTGGGAGLRLHAHRQRRVHSGCPSCQHRRCHCRRWLWLRRTQRSGYVDTLLKRDHKKVILCIHCTNA